jgi:uncharacterized protein
MAAAFNTIDLDQLALAPGAGRRIELEAEPPPIELGGQTYAFDPARIPAQLEVSRTSSGHAMRLTFDAVLAGPCMRCLEDANVALAVEAREVHQPGTGDEELDSPYVAEGELDVQAWAHDALILNMPATLLCRADCAGLCPVCGESLNDAEPAAHEHETAPDPRWAKLRELLD